jgi:AcrR family transcriptional regulator
VARSARKTSGTAAHDKRVRTAVGAGVDEAGVHPTHQSRSRAKHDALITSGIRMLAERDYRSLSIADLTAANGVSVGAFYARFSGKDAYFNALQRQVFADVAAESEALFAKAVWEGKPARVVLDAFVGFFVDLVRRHRGVIFAALQQETSLPTAWTPVRKSGAAIASPFMRVLAPKLTHLAPALRTQRVGFAVQVLYGTLINAVLHDPGPVALSDARLVGEMQRALAAYLGLAAAAKTTVKRKDKAENGR